MIRILNIEPRGYASEARKVLCALGEVVETELSRQELIATLPAYDVLIVRLAHSIDGEVIKAGRSLRAIVSATTGLDHIDVDSAVSAGISVLSLKGEVEFLRTISATAEHTWSLLLALLRRIPEASRAAVTGEWNRDAFRGTELEGKRLGILGLGRIGTKIARYGVAFGMRVFAFDPTPLEVMENVKMTHSMEELLGLSDVFSIHVPLMPDTDRLVGARELAMLPHGSFLVNTSRGQVLDEEALLGSLNSGHLAGAALDVLCEERRLILDNPIFEYARARQNLIITPHIGGATAESMAKTELFMARKLERYLTARDGAGATA